VTGRGIVFVSHDATRTGAPIALLQFLRWFKKNGNRPFSVLFGAGGDLAGEFEELTDTCFIDRGQWRRDALRTRFLIAAQLGAWTRFAESRGVRQFAAKTSPALVYVNSIASAHVIELLTPNVPVLTHVHELDSSFRLFQGHGLTRLLSRTAQFIACSNVTREHLARKCGVAESRIETVHESIPVSQVRAERGREAIFDELGIPRDALLVAGSGTACWRKGTDLFIHMARTVCQYHSHAYFCWVGGGWCVEFERDVRLAGLAKRIRFTGEVVKPADYFAASDIFVLTSREDPYPLVCLEAAALEKPIICFMDGGGAPEFIEEDCGFIVPYLDTVTMAERVVTLLNSPESRIRMGHAAGRKVAQRHDISLASPRIMEIMERTIERDSRNV